MSIKDKIISKIPAAIFGKQILKSEIDTRYEVTKTQKMIQELDAKTEYLFWLLNKRENEKMLETQKRVFLELPKATGKLRDLQNAENIMLRMIKEVCNENGLQFFLLYGTLLGAIRHKGFIPWDDDLDIGMLQEDYVAFEDKLSDHEYLQVHKYCLPNFHGFLSKVKFKGFEAPYIDVFVFERLDCDASNVSECWMETQAINQKFCNEIGKLVNEKYKYIDYECRPIYDQGLDVESKEILNNCRNATSWLSNSGQYFARTISGTENGRIEEGVMSYQDQYPLLEDAVEFEGEKYSVWKSYEKKLEQWYGDYWSFPPSIRGDHSAELQDAEECIEYMKEKGLLKVE